MNDQELRDQCRKEAEAKYPPHLAPDEIIGDHFMLVRVAVANTLFDERTKSLRLVEAGQALRDYIVSSKLPQDERIEMAQQWDSAEFPYTQTKHPTE